MYNYFACGSSCEVLWLVCLCVCVSVQQDISGTTRTVFTKFFAHVAYGCGLVFLQHVDDRPHHLSPGRGFFPIENALYSIAFGTHRWVCLARRTCLLRGGDDPQRGKGSLEETCPTSLTPLIIVTSATKEQFCIYLLTVKSYRIQFLIIREHSLD